MTWLQKHRQILMNLLSYKWLLTSIPWGAIHLSCLPEQLHPIHPCIFLFHSAIYSIVQLYIHFFVHLYLHVYVLFSSHFYCLCRCCLCELEVYDSQTIKHTWQYSSFWIWFWKCILKVRSFLDMLCDATEQRALLTLIYNLILILCGDFQGCIILH